MIYLASNHQPHAKIRIKFDSVIKIADCLLDTGFSSGLALPEKYLTLLKTPSKWKQTFELADGSLVEFDLYKLEVTFGTKTKVISAIFSKSNDALLGMEFLDGFRLLLDLINYKISLS